MNLKILFLSLISSTIVAAQTPTAQKEHNGETIKKILPVRELQKIVFDYLSDELIEGQKFFAKNPITSLTFSTDSALLAFTDSRETQLWQLNPTQKLIQTIPTQSFFKRITGTASHIPATTSAFSPDGIHFALKYNTNQIQIWQKKATTSKDSLFTLKQSLETPYPITVLTFSVDGMQLAAGQDKELVSLYTLQDNKFELENYLWLRQSYTADKLAQIKALVASRPTAVPILSLAFSPTGTLAVSHKYDLEIWQRKFIENLNTEIYSLRSSWLQRINQIPSLAFSPDGTLLAGGSADGIVYIWKYRKNQTIKPLVLQQKFAVTPSWGIPVAFSPDGKIFMAGSENSTIQFWDIDATGRFNKTDILTLSAPAAALAFSPDGRYIAAAYSNTVQLYKNAKKIVADDLGITNLKLVTKEQPPKQILTAQEINEID